MTDDYFHLYGFMLLSLCVIKAPSLASKDHEFNPSWRLDQYLKAKIFLNNSQLLSIRLGADINLPDNYGRTPLHVASAVDYPEMVEFLIEMGANINALTKDEHQTPLHYAAQNDATSSLKVLLNLNANIDAFDYKERTPLQVYIFF